MQLRNYQHKFHDDINQAWRTGARNVLGVLPTGGGKTVTFSKIVGEERGASAVLAHRGELIEQMSLALAREAVRHSLIGPKALAQRCINNHINELGRTWYDPNARTACGSVQSIENFKDNSGWLNQVQLWVQDETHHLLKDNQFGRAVLRFPNARGLGVTATPGRTDGKGLGRHADGLMDTMVFGPSPGELIAAGYLSKYKIFAPPSNLDLTNVHITAGGDFSRDELKEATKKSTVLGDTVAHYIKHAFGKSGLTFADSIENATDIAARFRAAGVPAEVISGKTPDTLRALLIARFKNKDILQLVSVSLIDEGFDCPGVEVVSDAAATESFNRFAQRFGRGLRILPGKTHMIYLDHVGNTLRHGLPDAPRAWTLNRRDKRAKKNDDAIPLRVCINPLCVQPYERIYRCCPHCGTCPQPSARSAPEFVDGDLMELDAITLARLRGEIDYIDGAPSIPKGATPEIAGAIKRRHWERRESQYLLRNYIAWWSGLQRSLGRGDSQSYRGFYFKFGVDVGTAQTLSARDAAELTDKLKFELDKFGIDGTVNAELYLKSNQ